MKIIIGASKAASDYTLNTNEKIICYDNDRRKWGKKIAKDNTIINIEELQYFVHNTNCDIIIATQNMSALYFVKDVCKDKIHRILKLEDGKLDEIDLSNIPMYDIDRNEKEKNKIEEYEKTRDYYKENKNWKAYQHACQYIEIKKENLLMPEIGGIELTNYCNLHCPNCPTPTCKRKKGYMNDIVFEECFKYIAPSTTERFSLHGLGEPLLHPGFLRYLDKVIEIGRPVIISTNGILLSEEMIEKLFTLMNKINNCVIYVSFHTIRSVENWYNCVKWINKKPNNNVELYGQVLEHNSEEALRWLEQIGINDPKENPYIRFITSHSFAGNVTARKKRYMDIEVNNRFRNCYYHVNNITNVAWDGRLKTCCLDSELKGEIGDIFCVKEIRLGYEPYDLCHNCDPDWTSSFQ